MWEKIYLAALHSLWFTHKKLFSIFENNLDYKYFYDNISFETLKNLSLKDEQIASIIEKKKKLDIEKLYKKLLNLWASIVIYWEENYPENLVQIPNKPFLFYMRWIIPEKRCFSVVWSRKISPYGEKAIEKIIPDLAKYFVIVSGWAAWCDTKAHKETLKTAWYTIAVLWTGIDINYPIENSLLYDKIVEKWWAIISIFPIWTLWSNFTFPIRNEIVAWLSIWTFIIEAEEKSGSLITAKLALDLWKDVFSLVWSIFSSYSVWTNNLVLSWEAKMITKASDILEEYDISLQKTSKKTIVFDNEIESQIYEILSLYSLTNDEIIKKISLEVSLVSLKLSIMELKWLIKKTKFSKYEIV